MKPRAEYLEAVQNDNLATKDELVRVKQCATALVSGDLDLMRGDRLRRLLISAHLDLQLALMSGDATMIAVCRRQCRDILKFAAGGFRRDVVAPSVH